MTLDTKTETQVLAMIARGDTYETIKASLSEQGVSTSISTISEIKKRNSEALAFMRQTLVEHEVNQSTKLLTKGRQLLERKLDRALNVNEAIADLKEQYEHEEIDDKQFEVLLNRLVKSELSLAELTSLTKEMFNQSQVEQGKPTSITENPEQAKKNLRTLLEAISKPEDATGDRDRQIMEAIFPQDDNA